MTDSPGPGTQDGPDTPDGPDALDAEVLRERAVTALLTARERTTLLTDSVDDHELTAQHSPLMSPLVWDLAHIGNQEELWLLRGVGGREAMRPEIDGLYDAFEHPGPPAPPCRCWPPQRPGPTPRRCAAGPWTCSVRRRSAGAPCCGPRSPSG